MSTRIVFTEIVYNMSPSRNISKALKRFGIADDSSDILIVLPNPTAQALTQIRDAVHGDEQSNIPESLANLSDLKKIASVYALSDQELRNGSVLDSVVSRMACRDLR